MSHPIETPCRQICRLGSDLVCDGCGRSMGEIVQWLAMSDAERREIMMRVSGWITRTSESPR